MPSSEHRIVIVTQGGDRIGPDTQGTTARSINREEARIRREQKERDKAERARNREWDRINKGINRDADKVERDRRRRLAAEERARKAAIQEEQRQRRSRERDQKKQQREAEQSAARTERERKKRQREYAAAAAQEARNERRADRDRLRLLKERQRLAEKEIRDRERSEERRVRLQRREQREQLRLERQRRQIQRDTINDIFGAMGRSRLGYRINRGIDFINLIRGNDRGNQQVEGGFLNALLGRGIRRADVVNQTNTTNTTNTERVRETTRDILNEINRQSSASRHVPPETGPGSYARAARAPVGARRYRPGGSMPVPPYGLAMSTRAVGGAAGASGAIGGIASGGAGGGAIPPAIIPPAGAAGAAGGAGAAAAGGIGLAGAVAIGTGLGFLTAGFIATGAAMYGLVAGTNAARRGLKNMAGEIEAAGAFSPATFARINNELKMFSLQMQRGQRFGNELALLEDLSGRRDRAMIGARDNVTDTFMPIAIQVETMMTEMAESMKDLTGVMSLVIRPLTESMAQYMEQTKDAAVGLLPEKLVEAIKIMAGISQVVSNVEKRQRFKDNTADSADIIDEIFGFGKAAGVGPDFDPEFNLDGIDF